MCSSLPVDSVLSSSRSKTGPLQQMLAIRQAQCCDMRAAKQERTRQLYSSLTDSATEAFFQNMSSMNIMADAFCLTCAQSAWYMSMSHEFGFPHQSELFALLLSHSTNMYTGLLSHTRTQGCQGCWHTYTYTRLLSHNTYTGQGCKEL